MALMGDFHLKNEKKIGLYDSLEIANLDNSQKFYI